MPTGSAQARPLAFLTPPAWAEAQRVHVDELLLEQAHLEKMAAAGSVQFLFRLPLQPSQHRQLSALGREELVHFERTLKLLGQRGVAYEPQVSSGYAAELKKAVRKDRQARLVDELLVAAIIEARSHERMSMLADALRDCAPDAAAFYADLCPSEERHLQIYFDLAASLVDVESADQRHGELLAHEADVLRRLPFSARLHSGLPTS